MSLPICWAVGRSNNTIPEVEVLHMIFVKKILMLGGRWVKCCLEKGKIGRVTGEIELWVWGRVYFSLPLASSF